MVRVTVPSSTANIGPGFDTLGLALDLYNIYEFEQLEEGLSIEGCLDEYKNKNNLVYKSFYKTAQIVGAKVKGIKIVIESNIPVARGLGSSAACVVGGVFGANEILGCNLSKDELFKIAVEIEGHPDNVAPAIFGGLTASIISKGEPSCARYTINQNIKFCALIPNFETSTVQARKLLPKHITFNDAIFNISRLAILLKSLETGDFSLIAKSLEDRLHQPYRKQLIHEYDQVRDICMSGGSKAMFISGSGPTLMNIFENLDFTNRINDDIMKLKNDWKMVILRPDEKGVVAEIKF